MKCSPQIKYVPPDNIFRRKLYFIVRNPKFEFFIMAVIALNIFFMMLYFYDMPKSLEDTLFWANIVFVVIFGLEFLVKVTGLG
jgi:hypothetical protein